MKRHDRYPKSTKDENGNRLCRGCRTPVPKGRQTWCSNPCYDKYEPGIVRRKVERRDKGVCYLCGVDTIYLREAYYRISHRERHGHAHRLMAPASAIIWCMGRAHRIIKALGWPSPHRDWWEADHIIPFSEGGETILENLRTLCVRCHKARTKAWHKERSNKVPKQQLALIA